MSADELREAGNAAFRSGAFDRALGLYTKALAAAPGDVHLLCNRAATLSALHKHEQALRDASDAARHDASSAKAVARAAMEAARLGCARDAEAILLTAPEALDDAAAKALAQARGELERIETTLRALHRGVDEWLRMPRDVSHEHAREDAAALTSALQAAPDAERLAFALVHALIAARMYDAAHGVTQGIARNRAAGVEGHMTATVKVKEHEIAPQSLPSLAVVSALVQAARGELVVDGLSAVLRGDPDGSTPEGRGVPTLLRTLKHVAALKEKGNAAFKTKSFPEAVAAYQEAVAYSQEHLPFVPGILYTNLAATFGAAGDATQAAVASKTALQAWQYNAKAWLRLANALTNSAPPQRELALAALTAAAILAPTDADVGSKLAQARARAGHDEEDVLVHPDSDAEAALLVTDLGRAAKATASASGRAAGGAAPASRVQVIDVYATWCGPCKMLAPHFTKLASAHPGAAFIKIDGDKCPSTAASLGVRAYPTLIVRVDGKETERMEGADVAKLTEMVKSALASVHRGPSQPPCEVGWSAYVHTCEYEPAVAAALADAECATA